MGQGPAKIGSGRLAGVEGVDEVAILVANDARELIQGFGESGSGGAGRIPECGLFWLAGGGSGFFGVIQVPKRW